MQTKLKSKRTQAIIALAIAALLVLSGTFAWYTFSQNRINTFNLMPTAPNVNLHDDFAGGPEKDVYVENSGDFNVLVRVRLSELIKRGNDLTPENAVDDHDAFGWHVHAPSADGCDICDFEAHKYFDWTMNGQKFYMPAHNSAKGSDSVEPLAIGDKEAVIDYAALLKDAFTEFYASDQAKLDTVLALMDTYLGGDDTAASDLLAEIAEIPDTYTISVKQYAEQPEAEHLRRLNEVRLTLVPDTIITMQDWINGTTYGTPLFAGDFWVIDSDGWCYWANALAPNSATGQLLSEVTYKNNYSNGEFTYKINVHLNTTSLDGTSLATFFLVAEQNGGISDDAMILMFLASGEYIFGEDGEIYHNEGGGFYRKINKNNGRYVNYTLGEKVYVNPGTLPGGDGGGMSVGGQFDIDDEGNITDGGGYQIEDIAIGDNGVPYYDVGGGVYLAPVDDSGNPDNSGEKYAIVHTGTDGQTGNDDDIGPVRAEGNFPQWYFVDITDVTDGDVIEAGQKGTLIRANDETEIPVQTFGVQQSVYRVQSITRGENGLLYLKLDEDLYAVAFNAYADPVNLTMSEVWGTDAESGEPETVPVPSTYYIIYPAESGKIGTENDTTDITPVISEQPVVISGIYGDTATTLSVTASGAGTRTYQWYKNGTPIAGATSNTLEVPYVADSGDYYCTVTANVKGHSLASVNTDTVTVSITARPITITAGSASKDYDGTPLTHNSYAITSGSLAVGDNFSSVTVTGTITNVGFDDNVISAYTIMRSGTDVTANYNVTTAKGVLTVTQQLYSGGSGTLANPYLIGTKADLEYLRDMVHAGGNYSNNKHFRQIADIDLENAVWDPIGTTAAMRFRGTYDGDGYTVSGLNVNRTDNLSAGLFGRTINATIKNIAVKGFVKSTGNSNTGGIVGWAEGSTITQCVFDGTVESDGNSPGGGIVGFASSSSTISNCYVTYGSVIKRIGGAHVAGIVGTLDGSSAQSNYSLAEVLGGGIGNGGVIGTMAAALTVDSNTFLRTAQINSGLNAANTIGLIEVMSSGYFSELNSTLTATNNSTITAANLVALLDAGAEGSGKAWIQYVPGGSWPLPATIRDSSLGDYTGDPNYASGDGTAGKPYQIANKAQLEYLRDKVNLGTNYAGTYFEQTANIDLGGTGWTPIGLNLTDHFGGTYNGGGYKISGLSINGAANNQGLFGYISGSTVKNLAVSGSVANSNSFTGGIVGYTGSWSTISNCTFSGTVSGNSSVGGITGCSSYSTVQNCYVAYSSTVTGGTSVGGIVGTHNDSTATTTHCYSLASVTGNTNVGGIVGNKTGTSKVLNSAFMRTSALNDGMNAVGTGTGAITNIGYFSNIGPLDKVMPTNGSSYNSYLITLLNDGQTGTWTRGVTSWPVLTAIREEHYGWGGGYVNWSQTDTDDYALITTPAELAALPYYINLGGLTGDSINTVKFRLGADIDLAGQPWTPIGKSTATFRTEFDGNGHTISGLNVQASTVGSGLFGNVSGGTIKNLYVKGYVSGSTYQVGGIAGNIANSSTISDCAFYGTVKGTSPVGGIVGYADSSSVQNCFVAYGSEVVSSDRAGGIIGTQNSSVTATNCYSLAKITGTGDTGGVVGYNPSSSSVINSAFLRTDSLNNTLNAIGGKYGTATSVGYFDSSGGTLTSTNTSGTMPANLLTLLRTGIGSGKWRAATGAENNGYPVLIVMN